MQVQEELDRTFSSYSLAMESEMKGAGTKESPEVI